MFTESQLGAQGQGGGRSWKAQARGSPEKGEPSFSQCDDGIYVFS